MRATDQTDRLRRGRIAPWAACAAALALLVGACSSSGSDADEPEATTTTEAPATTTGDTTPDDTPDDELAPLHLDVEPDNTNPWPAVTDGTTAYLFGTDPESGQSVLLAVDGTTGTETWRLEGPLEGCGIALLDDDRVAVVGAEEGPLGDGGATFAIVDATSGEVTSSVAFAAANSTYCLPMAAAGDTVAVADALGDVTGWDVSGDDPTESWSIDEQALDAIATVDDRFVIHRDLADAGPNLAGELVLVDPADGSAVATTDASGRLASHPLLVDGTTVVAIGTQTEDEDVLGTLIAVEVDGDELAPSWTYPLSLPDAGEDDDRTADRGFEVVATDGDVLVAQVGSELFGIDLADGSLRWRVETDGFRNSAGPPIVHDGVIYDTTFGGPALVTLDAADGTALESLTDEDVLPEGVTHRQVQGPVIDDHLLVEGTDEDGLLVIAFHPII